MSKVEFYRQMHAKYTAKLPDLDAFLRRIGVDREDISLTKEGLDMLQFAHLCSVPFENLDIVDYDVKLDYGIEELFEKIVRQRRGGYCFELNSLYTALLLELGFEVYAVGARVAMNKSGDIYPPIAHRAAIVIIDGKRYYTDVGFGLSISPGMSICIEDCEKQVILGETFSVEDRPYNNKLLIRHTDEGPTELFLFVPDPFNLLDFMTYNTTVQAIDFREKRMVNLRKPGGSISIDGNILRRTKNGQKHETILETAESANKALTEEFGMILTTPVK